MAWPVRALLLGFAGLLVGLALATRYPAEWVLVMGSAGLGFGVLSSLVYSRRLMFVAAASPHAAFLAASAAIPIQAALGGPIEAYTVLVGLLVVYMVGFLVHRGVDPDEATSIMVSLSSALGALAMYYAVREYPAARVTSIIIGDPLLASKGDVMVTLLAGSSIALAGLLGAREIFYAGVDPDDARLSGLRTWLYDAILYTLIGLSTVGMVRIVGFVVEHVFILLPGAVAAIATRGVYQSLALSGSLGLLAGTLGLGLAVLLDLPPSPMAGLVLVASYLTALAWSRR